MSWLGKLGVVAVSCAISSLVAVAITGGAVGDDPTFSACAEQVQGELRYLAPGETCASVGISGREVNWDRLGGLTRPQAGRLRRMLALEKRLLLEETQMSYNLQYLMLQQKMQDESRRFSLLSNIMKTKHDTAKNSISNVR